MHVSLLLLLCSCLTLNAENTSYTDGAKIGLPLGTWSILDLNETQRGGLCAQQIEFCQNDCGSTSLNFCDLKTMQWGCNCQQKLPKALPFEWPVTVAECSGKEQACIAGCTDCQEPCQNYFKCHRPGSELSQLRRNAPVSSSSSLSIPPLFLILSLIFVHATSS